MSKGKILVVDDDRLVLATLSYGLTQAGFEVIDADNGDDAILLAREHRPELALLDIRMEGLTGFDVAAYLREFLQTPFMFLSAFTDEATVAKVKELGAVAYLVKPLDIAQIVPAVEAAFARSAAPAPAAAVSAPPSELPSLEVTALAVGVLMHRYSLPRDEALARLMSLASADGHSLPEQARRIVDAVELLARPGQKP
ncbi:MAG: response regulator [Comamonadaceae bacterium]|nr:response regulator [Comamonadaceae bacterium]